MYRKFLLTRGTLSIISFQLVLIILLAINKQTLREFLIILFSFLSCLSTFFLASTEQVNNSKFLSDAKTDSFYIAMCSEYFFFFCYRRKYFLLRTICIVEAMEYFVN